MFGSTTAFQNGMTQPGSTNDHGPAPLQGKGQGEGSDQAFLKRPMTAIFCQTGEISPNLVTLRGSINVWLTSCLDSAALLMLK